MRRMKTEKMAFLERNLSLITAAVMLSACVLILFAPAVFADDVLSDDSVLSADGALSSEGTAVTVTIVCGEHGKVNDETGKLTKMVSFGGDLHLTFAADTGYLIGKVLINDEPLAESDLAGIAGETSGQLDLEGLEDNLSVQVIFMTPAEYESQPVSPGTTIDPFAGGNGSENGDAAPGTYTPSDGSGENNPSGQEGDGGSDAVTDLDTAGDDGDNEFGDDEDGFEPDNNWGTEDDAEDSANQDTDEYQGTYDDIDYGFQGGSDDAGTDTDASAERTGIKTESEDGIDSSEDSQSNETEGTRSPEDTISTTTSDKDSDDEDDGKGDYKGDYSTPKTGDEAPAFAEMLLVMGLSLLCLSIAVSLRKETERSGGDGE